MVTYFDFQIKSGIFVELLLSHQDVILVHSADLTTKCEVYLNYVLLKNVVFVKWN